MTQQSPLPPSATRGRINNRWRLRMTPDRVRFHAEHPDWQREQTASLAQNLESGDVVFYAGAECGDYPALLASWGCRVALIEPQPRSWPSIRAHFNGNNAKPLCCFVGFASDANRGDVASALTADWPRAAVGPIEPDPGFLHLSAAPVDVPAITLDALASSTLPPRGICIDTEGSELRVLRGAERVLREHRPLVWLSVHLDAQWMTEQYPDESWDAVQAFLSAVGYEWDILAESHERHVLCRPA